MSGSKSSGSSFSLQDCVALTDCFGNNASAPYLMLNLPPHPDRPGELPESIIGDIPRVPEGMSASWLLESNEAVVIVGRTPPTAKYYGLTPHELIAIEVRRDCGGEPSCIELETGFPGVALDENLFFIFRAYLQPGSTVSAGHDEILTERVIKVTSR